MDLHQTTPKEGRAWRVPHAGLLAAVALAFLVKIAISATIVAQIFGYAFQVDESESMIVAETQLLDHGVNIYGPPRPDIFISAPYTPLYYLLTWPGSHFGGALPSFKPGRAVSLLAVGGIIVLLALLTLLLTKQRGKRDLIAAGIGGAVFASLGLVAFWGSIVKPDITALFFSLLCLYGGGRWLTQATGAAAATRLQKIVGWRRYGWLYAAALAGALALCTKQTSVAGAAALGLYLLAVRRDLWAVLRFGGVYLVLALGPLLALQAATDGGLWWHIITVHQLPWSLDHYLFFMGGFSQMYALYIALALICVALVFFDGLRRKNSGTDGLAAIYVVMGALAGLSAGTYGGNHNHLLELAAAVALAVGLCVARLRAWSGAYAVALLVLLVQIGGLIAFEGKDHSELRAMSGPLAPLKTLLTNEANDGWLAREYRDPHALDPDNRFDQIAAYLHNAVGPVYSDNVSLVLASGKPITTTDPYTQTHAVYFHRWDETQLVAAISAKTFRVIAVQDFGVAPDAQAQDSIRAAGIYITPAMARAIQANYIGRKDRETVYEPRK